MSDTDLEGSLRLAAEKVLVARYGAISPISGRGVRRGSRFALMDGTKEIVCLVKTSSTHGRISFPSGPNGSWGALDEADRVVVARVNPSGGGILVRMFDHSTILNAFSANLRALEEAGTPHLPVWLNPDREEQRGLRGVGDGFADRAIWAEVVPDSFLRAPERATPPVTKAVSPLASLGTVAEVLAAAKERIAALTGVPASAVSLDLSVSWS